MQFNYKKLWKIRKILTDRGLNIVAKKNPEKTQSLK